MSLVLVVVAAIVAGISGYPNGAPKLPMPMMMDTMCTTGNIRPNHRNAGRIIMPMKTNPPFTLTVENPIRPYGPGKPIRVTLKANPGKTFKGFYITADAEDAKTGVSGSYQSAETNTAHEAYFCVKGITHNNGAMKPAVTVIYNPPTNFTHGRIQFKATVVENFNTFYTGILSETVNAVSNVDKQSDYMKKEMARMMSAMMAGNGGGAMFGGANFGEMMSRMKSMMPALQNQMGQMGQVGQTGIPNLGGVGQGGMGQRGIPNMGQGGMGQGGRPGLGNFFQQMQG